MPYKDQSTTDTIAKVQAVAQRKGVSMAQVAVAWMFAKPGVTAPIVGTTNLSNLEDILSACPAVCGPRCVGAGSLSSF